MIKTLVGKVLRGGVLLGSIGSAWGVDAEPQALPPLGHSRAAGDRVELSPNDWAWLSSKDTLVPEISAPNHSANNGAANALALEGMAELASRWALSVLVDEGKSSRREAVSVHLFVPVLVLLLIALGWIAYLRFLIRKRQQAVWALSSQMEFMRGLINGTPHPLYLRDRQGRLVICNAAYLKALNLQGDDVVGKTVLESRLGSVREAHDYHQNIGHVLRDGRELLQDRRLTLPNGHVLTVFYWMLPYRNSEGEAAGIIGGWVDVSERQQILLDLREAKETADKANRAKTTFLATMSHEIRTPLNAVIGMLELVMKKADQQVFDRSGMDVAWGAAHGLLDLIGDILDITRIESGRLSLAPERANLRALLESVVRVFEGLAQQKGVQLIVESEAAVHCDVLIDPMRLKQILSNLLSNAIKFTPEGQVRLVLRVVPCAVDQRVQVSVTVEDSGCGISALDQQQLFTPFGQVIGSPQTSRNGSGLGLVISRALCEMMGGQMTLTSQLGQGTQVEVRFELAALVPAIEIPAEDQLQPEAFQALDILVVDDHAANRLLLIQQLSYLGHRVAVAENGVSGFDLWRNGRFDVVITDCSMPLMNGYELAKAIRRHERQGEGGLTLILGFTANAQPEEKERCLAAGMNECLFKPISLEHLNRRLQQAVNCSVVSIADSALGVQGSAQLDLTTLSKLTRGDPASINSLLGDLASSNEQDMAHLLRLFTQHDLPGLANIAHRVKGAARMINARSLLMCCEHVELACQQSDCQALTEAVNALYQSMEQLALRLQQAL